MEEGKKKERHEEKKRAKDLQSKITKKKCIFTLRRGILNRNVMVASLFLCSTVVSKLVRLALSV